MDESTKKTHTACDVPPEDGMADLACQKTEQPQFADLAPGDKTPEILFDYMRDLIYNSESAELDVEKLHPAYQDVGAGMLYFEQLINEVRAFASALGKGDLKADLPGRDNELASPLKALHASLRHMTWQSQQVAKGDYKQRVDFMGEFSEAFNSMVVQLDYRQRALEQEIETSREKTHALEEINSLVTNLTENIPQILLVFDQTTDSILYQNKAATQEMTRNPDFVKKLLKYANGEQAASPGRELFVREGDMTRYFTVQPYDLQWGGQNACAFVVEDVSSNHARVMELEKRANWDELTRMYNRHFGMQTLQTWLDEERLFTVCFVDLDHLKFINDTFGHSEGDQYLIRAASLIKEYMPNAVTCRLGGDEFMVLCPMSEEEATESMKALSTAFSETGAATTKPYLSSLSYGLVEVEPGSDMPASQILSLADERMYHYKKKNKKTRGSEPPIKKTDKKDKAESDPAK